jgi:hypothetical protein
LYCLPYFICFNVLWIHSVVHLYTIWVHLVVSFPSHWMQLAVNAHFHLLDFACLFFTYFIDVLWVHFCIYKSSYISITFLSNSCFSFFTSEIEVSLPFLIHQILWCVIVDLLLFLMPVFWDLLNCYQLVGWGFYSSEIFPWNSYCALAVLIIS